MRGYLLGLRRVRPAAASEIATCLCRHSSQTCCPWNVQFSWELRETSFATREALAGRDARTLAREILDMAQEEFSGAGKGSSMKQARLRGLKRNAAVVLRRTRRVHVRRNPTRSCTSARRGRCAGS
jgi:epoxyqueuosine reductase QueG